MSETIRFDEIPSSGDFPALPEDRYTVECVEARLETSKAGNKKITTQFKVTEGEFENRRLWHDFSLVQSALFNLKNYFEAAGLSTEGEIEYDDLPKLMEGTKVTAFVTQQEFNNKLQNRMKNWAPIAENDSSGGSLFD
jgi:hypothetical protein